MPAAERVFAFARCADILIAVSQLEDAGCAGTVREIAKRAGYSIRVTQHWLFHLRGLGYVRAEIQFPRGRSYRLHRYHVGALAKSLGTTLTGAIQAIAASQAEAPEA